MISRRPPELATDLPLALRTEALAKAGWVDTKLATTWLAEHWKNRACPVCRENDWGILEQLLEMPVGPRVPIAPQEYPCVMIACRNCGHALLFSAARMGIVPANVYLISRDQMEEVATTSTAQIKWWMLVVLTIGLGSGLSFSVLTSKPFQLDQRVLSAALVAGIVLVSGIALVAILLERRRRRSLLREIEEESKVPTESEIEPLDGRLN